MPRLRSKALVWIVRQGAGGPEVLLLQRPERRGGGFHPVTGKAEEGEPIGDAAAREAREETGLTGQLVDLDYEHQYVSATGKRFREHAFLLRVDSGDVAISDEHERFEWVPPDHARAAVSWPAHREALERALSRFTGE
ncbi:MAG TPA: NUDIX domain-containing protein [Myxococcales bacterium]|nr:NUDIX domain-containing protein [Myxococcales bacterium]